MKEVEWRDGWMHGRPVRGRASFLPWGSSPLRWGTSSLRCFFPEQPALSCLPAGISVASATCIAFMIRLATSSCNPTIAQSSTMIKNYLQRSYYIHSCFAARRRANAFCRSRLQTGKAGRSSQINQHAQSADSGDDAALLREWGLFHHVKKWSAHLQSVAHFTGLI